MNLLKAVCVGLWLTLFAGSALQASAGQRPVTMMSGLGDWHHPVSTKNKQAQEFFDQGLRLIYAFNHDEAARSFRKAAELDPSLAIAYWGVAEAVGPNYNDPASEDRFKEAHAAIQKAAPINFLPDLHTVPFRHSLGRKVFGADERDHTVDGQVSEGPVAASNGGFGRQASAPEIAANVVANLAEIFSLYFLAGDAAITNQLSG